MQENYYLPLSFYWYSFWFSFSEYLLEKKKKVSIFFSFFASEWQQGKGEAASLKGTFVQLNFWAGRKKSLSAGSVPRHWMHWCHRPSSCFNVTAVHIWCGEEKQTTGFPALQPPCWAADAGRLPALRKHVEVQRGASGAGTAAKAGREQQQRARSSCSLAWMSSPWRMGATGR